MRLLRLHRINPRHCTRRLPGKRLRIPRYTYDSTKNSHKDTLVRCPTLFAGFDSLKGCLNSPDSADNSTQHPKLPSGLRRTRTLAFQHLHIADRRLVAASQETQERMRGFGDGIAGSQPL